MSDSDDRPLTYRERAIIEATAEATVRKIKDSYDPKEYGPEAMKATLYDFFQNLSPADHIDHHKWVAETKTGKGRSWADFGYSMAKIAAGMVLVLITTGLVWNLINYLKAGAPGVPGVSH